MNTTQIHELAQKAYDLGFHYEKKYKGCAQCTIAAVLETLQQPHKELFQAASGLAAGGGATCSGSCGGFVGGMLVFGYFCGRRREFFDDDTPNKRLCNLMSQELEKRFVDAYGSVICNQIHSSLFNRTFDLTNQEDKDQFEILGAHTTVCTSVVALASKWSIEILFSHLDESILLGSEISQT